MKCKVAVLLSSYNGEKYIREQIDSVLSQEGVEVILFIRDDGSSDRTPEILKTYEHDPRCIIYFEENVGVIKSFFDLIQKAHGYDYYALCDQDDVWDVNKLEEAVKHLLKNQGQASMYFSATRVVDESLNEISDAKMISGPRALSLNEVLLTNNATGCTIVFNQNLREHLLDKLPERMIMHDHWIYLVCLALGGKVIYDNKPHISYRQHEENVLGNRKTLASTIKYSSFSSMKGVRSSLAKFIYQSHVDTIPNENKAILKAFAEYDSSFINRVKLIKMEIKTIKSIKRKLIFVFQVFLGYL